MTENEPTEPVDLRTVTINQEFQVCPACGYDRGFHTSLLNMSASRGTHLKTTREVFRVILICPNCGARFDVGWKIPMGDIPGVSHGFPAVVSVNPEPLQLHLPEE
jgi:transcription elongation factor Elf1